jgi:hypothetical protein
VLFGFGSVVRCCVGQTVGCWVGFIIVMKHATTRKPWVAAPLDDNLRFKGLQEYLGV